MAEKYNYLKANDSNLWRRHQGGSLSAIVSVKLTDPQFEGQTKTKLGNSEIRGFVESTVAQGLSAYLEENQVGKVIMERPQSTAFRASGSS